MNNDIYLSRKSKLKEGFFLRVIKDPKQLGFEIDPQISPKFSPGKKGKLDVLKVWVKPIGEPHSNVLVSDTPLIENANRVTKKVKIKLINSQTNKTVDQAKFAYQKAFLESHIDDWSDRLEPS